MYYVSTRQRECVVSSNLLINHVLMKEVAPNLEAKAEYESYKPVQQLQ